MKKKKFIAEQIALGAEAEYQKFLLAKVPRAELNGFEPLSPPGEIVLDPFLGIGTVAYQAIHMGRIGWGCELSKEYWHCAVGYCEQAELQRSAPTLFDLADFGAKVITKEAA